MINIIQNNGRTTSATYCYHDPVSSTFHNADAKLVLVALTHIWLSWGFLIAGISVTLCIPLLIDNYAQCVVEYGRLDCYGRGIVLQRADDGCAFTRARRC